MSKRFLSLTSDLITSFLFAWNDRTSVLKTTKTDSNGCCCYCCFLSFVLNHFLLSSFKYNSISTIWHSCSSNPWSDNGTCVSCFLFSSTSSSCRWTPWKKYLSLFFHSKSNWLDFGVFLLACFLSVFAIRIIMQYKCEQMNRKTLI